MTGINSFLLSIFTKRRFGSDAESLNQRLQSLTLIYMNLGMDCCHFLYSLMIWCSYPSQNPYIMLCFTTPLSIFCLLALRENKLYLSAFCSMLKVHISNVIASDATNFPGAARNGIMMYPTMIIFLTPSLKLQLLNMFFCFCECFSNSYKIMEIYKVT